MTQEIFRPRKPNEVPPPATLLDPGNPPHEWSEPIAQENAVPSIVQMALQKNKERIDRDNGEMPRVEMPRALTGNTNLDLILAGMKDQHHKYEEVQLPSMGRFYDGSQAPTNGKVHVRPMTGAEEEILWVPHNTKRGQAMNMIFRKCIREEVNPAQMLTVDRTFLLIHLRAISIGADYDVSVRCPACNVKFPTTISLARWVDPCPDHITPDSLWETLPKTGYRFLYRLPTGQDDNLVSERRDQRIKKGNQAADDTFTFRASLLIRMIEDPQSGAKLDDQQSIMALIGRLPMGDVVFMRDVLNDPGFGVNTKDEVDCPNCAEQFEIDMPMENSFFSPTRKKKTQESTQP